MEALIAFAFPEGDPKKTVVTSRRQFARMVGPSPNHMFVLTHNSGKRWTGYVRKYLPKVAGTDARADAGKTEVRALIVLVPVGMGGGSGTGGGGSSVTMWFGVLRTIEALLLQPPDFSSVEPSQKN